MLSKSKGKFSFKIVNLSEIDDEGRFIVEGYASSNDVDFQNDIISDEALKSSSKGLKGKPVCFEHDPQKIIGKCLDSEFRKGKLWVKDEITNKDVQEFIKKGKLYNLSISGQVTKVELVYLPELETNVRVIKKMHFNEHSIVFEGAQLEAKTIRWYITKTMNEEDLKQLQDSEESKYKCECLDCGKVIETTKHCSNVECPECGGEMRRAERPGEGDQEGGESENEEKSLIQEDLEKALEKKDFSLVKKALKKIRSGKKDYSYGSVVRELSDDKGDDAPIYQVFRPGIMELEDSKKSGANFRKQILRTGKWHHSAAPGGVLNITKEALKKIYNNFKNKVRKHVYVPLQHTSDPLKNTGEVVSLELSKDGNELYADINVKDESVANRIKKGLIKGVSASIDQNYTEKKEGKKVGPTLVHTALVSEPYIKSLSGFVPLSEEFKGKKSIQVFEDENNLILQDMKKDIKKIKQKIENEDEEEKKEEETEEKEEKGKEEKVEKKEEKEEEDEKEDEEEKKEDDDNKDEEEKKEDEKEGESDEDEEKSSKSPKKEEDEEEEESESETELADKGVKSAKTEEMWEGLLKKGKVVPAQKKTFFSLFSSTGTVKLGDDEVDIKKALSDWFEKQPSIVSFEEKGTTGGGDDKKGGDEEKEIPDEVNKFFDKMELSEDVREDAYKGFKKLKKEEGEKKTPF